MATTTTITKMLLRRGNDSDRKSTILASGEPGFTLDTKRLWIGDGQTPGGYPALSADESFFNYDDGVNPCVLRIKVGAQNAMKISDEPTLSQILASTAAGPNGQESYFHPTDRDIKTSHDINLMGSRASHYINSAGNLHIHQNDAAGEELILGASSGTLSDNNPYIQIQNTSDGGRINIKCKNFQVTSDSAHWADAEHTMYQDPTIDINVHKNPSTGVILPPGNNGQSAHSCGIHIAHNNFLSAGNIMVGTEDVGEQTMLLTPPVYGKYWAKELDNVRDSSGKSSSTNSFEKGDTTYAYEDTAGILHTHATMSFTPSKPIVFTSARPQQYLGDANIVLESGLIVYGDAGAGSDGNDLNAYRINQSLDTRAQVTFQSVNIDDGAGGGSVDVGSGGTGRTSFAENAIVTTLGNTSTTQGLRDTVLTTGQLLGGTANGAKVMQIKKATGSNPGVSVNADASSGDISIENTFMPSFKPTQANSDSVNPYFEKVRKFSGRNTTYTPDNHNGELSFPKTDWIDPVMGVTTNKGTLSLNHLYKGDFEEFSEATQAANPDHMRIGHGNTSTVFPQLRGRVINSLDIDKAGHVVGATVVNHHETYAQLDPVKANGDNYGTLMPAPDNSNVTSVEADAPTNYTVNNEGKVTDNTFINNTRVFGTASHQLGAYGTNKQIHKMNLHTLFCTHKGVDAKVSAALGTIDSKTTWLQLGTSAGNQSFTPGVANSNNINFNNRILEFKASSEHYQIGATSGKGLYIKKVSGTDLTFSGSALNLENHGKGVSNVSSGLVVNNRNTTNNESRFIYTGGTQAGSTGQLDEVWHASGRGNLLADWTVVSDQVANAWYPVSFMGYKRFNVSAKSGADLMNMQKDNALKYNPGQGTLQVAKYLGNISSTSGVNSDMTSAITSAVDSAVDGLETAPSKVTPHAEVGDSAAYLLHVQSPGNGSTAQTIRTDNQLVWDTGNNHLTVGGDLKANGLYIKGHGSVEYSNVIKMVIINPTTNPDRYMAICRPGIQNTTQDPSAGIYLGQDGNNYYDVMDGDTHTFRCNRADGNLADLQSASNSFGVFRVRGDVIAFYSFSDKRLKKNITTIDSSDALNKILNLQGVTYKWRDKRGEAKGTQIGLVAQDVEQHVPQVVEDTARIGSDKQYKRVDYDKLVPLLIESIKELSAKVELLESQLK